MHNMASEAISNATQVRDFLGDTLPTTLQARVGQTV